MNYNKSMRNNRLKFISLKIWFVLVCFYIFFSFSSCITAYFYDRPIIKLLDEIKSYEQVESVNVLYDEADWSYTLRILISFVDGNWILVDEITHTSEHIKVQACNGYYLFNYLKPNNEDSVYVLGFKYNFNAENILINNVIDIVKNYKIICEEYEKYDIVYNEKILAENYYYRQYTDHYLNEHESGEYTTFTVRRPLDDIFLKDWRKKY